MSGPLEGSMRTLKTCVTIISWMWCLHARLIRSLLSFCLRRMHAPAWRPVLLAVVSKDIHRTHSEMFQSSNSVNTAAACASSVPLSNRGTPKSFMPSPDTNTTNLSTVFFDVNAGSILPSQCTVSAVAGEKDAWIFLQHSHDSDALPAVSILDWLWYWQDHVLKISQPLLKYELHFCHWLLSYQVPLQSSAWQLLLVFSLVEPNLFRG